MVRAFFETLFTCSKPVPNRTQIGTDTKEKKYTDNLHLKPSVLNKNQTGLQNYSITDISMTDLGSFRSLLYFTLKKSKRERHIQKNVCSPEAQDVIDLVQEMQQARSRLMDCQALDKWIEKWQEKEFQRYESHKERVPRRHSVACSQLVCEKPRRACRKLAQGRALSEHALLSARHIKRRDELIRNLWEAVGPTTRESNEIRTRDPRSETWESFSTDVLEINNSLCKSELTVPFLHSPLRVQQTEPDETVTLNKYQPRFMESHVSQQKLGLCRMQSDLVTNTMDDSNWSGVHILLPAHMPIEKTAICDRVISSLVEGNFKTSQHHVSQAECVKSPKASTETRALRRENETERVIAENNPDDQDLHNFIKTVQDTCEVPVSKHIVKQTRPAIMSTSPTDLVHLRSKGHQFSKNLSTRRPTTVYPGTMSFVTSRISPISKTARLPQRRTLTGLQNLKLVQFFAERNRPGSAHLTGASIINSMNSNSKQKNESNVPQSLTPAVPKRSSRFSSPIEQNTRNTLATSMKENQTTSRCSTDKSHCHNKLGNTIRSTKLCRTDIHNDRSPTHFLTTNDLSTSSYGQDENFPGSGGRFTYEYYQPFESVESTATYSDDDTIRDDNKNNTNNNYVVSVDEDKDRPPGSPTHNSCPSTIQLGRQNNRRPTKRRPAPRWGSSLIPRQTMSHNQESTLPLLRLEELKSYTLTSSATTHVCDGKSRPEDQTSDTFILSAASEFLHSTSEEQFAFKHRPRPGIATGRKRKPSIPPPGEEHTSVPFEPLAVAISENKKSTSLPRKTLSPVQTDTVELTNKSLVEEFDDTWEKHSLDINATEPPVSEDELDAQQTPSNERGQISELPADETESQKPLRTDRPVKTAGKKQPVRFLVTQRKRPRRFKRTLGENGTKKTQGKSTTTTGKPPWNISTRNLARQFYDVRPIESILWPDGRIPEVYRLKEWLEPYPHQFREKFRLKTKLGSGKIRHKRHQLTRFSQQQSNIALSELYPRRENKYRKRNWHGHLYRNLARSGLLRTRKKLHTKEPSHMVRHKHESSTGYLLKARSTNDPNTEINCGDDLSTVLKHDGLRKNFHLNEGTERGDQVHSKMKNLEHRFRMKSLKPHFERKSKSDIRNQQPLNKKVNTTRSLVGRPRLWSVIRRQKKTRPRSRASSPRKTTHLRSRSRSHLSKVCNRFPEEKPFGPCQLVNDQMKVKFRRRIHHRPKSEFKRQANRIWKQYSYNNTDEEVSQDGEAEHREKVDFFAYVAIIPSEIDELVLPFRACNRLRACLKNIENLLFRLELEVAEMGDDVNANSVGNKKSIRKRKMRETGLGMQKQRTEIDKNTSRNEKEEDEEEEETKRSTHQGVKFIERLRHRFQCKHSGGSDSARTDLSLHDSLIVNNSAQENQERTAPSQLSSLTAHSDTIRWPYLDPERVRFWSDVLKDCKDFRLNRLLEELRNITDRRIFAIEQRTQTRIRLDETIVYSVHGLPCMELRIVAYRVMDLQSALVQLEMNLPRLYRQILFTERFYGDAAPGAVYRFPTTNEFIFASAESTACGQPSVSTVRRVIPVIEEARKIRRSRKSYR
ncbi:hypothetical protein FGIG_02949 [Fasciola gigantica]|uniref:Uncharacterized protein n=1 Tax=Fasciola gigantica TaxID=46835 RepID=A0A504YMU9_FASGI|nr:hypothetical protein FGIG_02949 [Fasciola gigantica]